MVNFCHVKKSDAGHLGNQLDAEPAGVYALILDLYASMTVIIKYIGTAETLFSMAVSIGCVLLYDNYGSRLTVDITWTLVSFVVVFPLTMSIKEAFKRRDLALLSLANVRGLLCSILVSHSRWDWQGTTGFQGRICPPEWARPTALPRTHVADLHELILRIVAAYEAYLLVPRGGRARHLYTPCGRHNAKQVSWAEESGSEIITVLQGRLVGAVEALKRAGLPATEASRINQYNSLLSREWEKIRNFKEYRTPQSMRSFARVVIHTLPAFYGPYFLVISRGISKDEHNIVFACIFACLFSMFMCSLLLVQEALENPFQARSLDSVRVKSEMNRTRRALELLLKDSRKLWNKKDHTMMFPQRADWEAKKKEPNPDDEPFVDEGGVEIEESRCGSRMANLLSPVPLTSSPSPIPHNMSQSIHSRCPDNERPMSKKVSSEEKDRDSMATATTAVGDTDDLEMGSIEEEIFQAQRYCEERDRLRSVTHTPEFSPEKEPAASSSAVDPEDMV